MTSPALNPPFAGLAELCRLADLQSARRPTVPPPTRIGCEGDQLAILAAEIERAGKDPAPDKENRMHARKSPGWFRRRVLGIPLAVAAVALAALAVAGGGTAYALTVSAPAPTAAPAGPLYACAAYSATTHTRLLEAPYTGLANYLAYLAANGGKCPNGGFEVTQAGGSGAQGPQGATGATGPAGPAGPQGPAGPAGTYTPVSVTVSTSVSNRDDSGNNGNWATDAFTRTVTVTRHSQAPASDCPSGAVKCWFYTATLADSGTFTTDASAKSPNAGTAISGTVMGDLSGGSDIEFYASSDSPGASGVPGTISGDSPATTGWVDRFFAAGTLITTPNLTDWSWTYVAPNTCEKWVDAYNNGDGGQSGDGDIAGVNACTS